MKELFAQHGISSIHKPLANASPGDGNAAIGESEDMLFEGSDSGSPTKMRFGSPEPTMIGSVLQASPDKSPSPTLHRPRRHFGGVGLHGARRPQMYDLTAWLSGPKGSVTLSLQAEQGHLGLYNVREHILTHAGRYEAHVHLNGVPINQSPISFNVTAAEASGRNSYIVAPEQPAFAKLPYEVKLYTVDKYNNKIGKGGTRVEGKIISANASACTVVDHKDGSYSLHFTVNQVGSYNMEVRVNGHKVKGVPVQATGGDAKVGDKKSNSKKVKKRRGSTHQAEEGKPEADKVGGSIFDSIPIDAPTAAPAEARVPPPGPVRSAAALKDVADLTATI